MTIENTYIQSRGPNNNDWLYAIAFNVIMSLAWLWFVVNHLG